MLATRAGVPADLVHLQNIDLKCFDDPWNREMWAWIGDNFGIQLVTYFGTPVAFSCQNHDQRSVKVAKLGVLPPFRGRGLSRTLLNGILDFTRLMRASQVEIVVPEYMCNPAMEQDCSRWLKRMGFRATPPLLANQFTYLGQPEAGIRFVLEAI